VRRGHRRGARWPPGMGSDHDVFPHPKLVGATREGMGTSAVPDDLLLPRLELPYLGRLSPHGCALVAARDGLHLRQRWWGVASSICDGEWYGRGEQSEAGARSILTGKQHVHRPF
jgi:hypothetical protein